MRSESRSPRLLIVDDEEPILAAMREYFSACGFEVDCAREQADAEGRLRGATYGAVIADLRLGGSAGVEGLEVLAAARRHSPSTRTILLSAYGSPQVEREARRRGADAFLPKPQPLAEVARLVRELLGNGGPATSPGEAAPSARGDVDDTFPRPGAARLESAEDAALVRRCLAGDARAWETLVRRYARLVQGIAFRSGLSRADCEDVMQTVFLKACRGLELLDRPGSVGFWLGTIARREAWKAKQRLARPGRGRGRADAGAEVPAEVLPELPSPGPLPDEELERTERLAIVHRALEELDGRCQSLLQELFFRSPLPSYDEAAESLGTPRGSLGPMRQRCLERLGRRLRRLGFQG